MLNIHNVTVHDELTVVEPKNLFSYRRKKLRSVYLFWKDPEFKLRGLTTKDIRLGFERKRVSTFKDILEDFCCLNLTDPHGNKTEVLIDDNQTWSSKGDRYIRFPKIGQGEAQIHPSGCSIGEARKIIQRSVITDWSSPGRC
jgi:hypothetical protein